MQRQFSGESNFFPVNGARRTKNLYTKQWTLTCTSHYMQTLTWKESLDLNINPETIKLLEEKNWWFKVRQRFTGNNQKHDLQKKKY